MNSSPRPTPRIQSGELIALRLFDIAYAIDLARAAELWSTRVGRTSRRSQLATTPPKAVAFDVPPLLLSLPPARIEIDGVATDAAATARIYDFGVVALALRVPVSDLAWGDFVSRCNALDRVVGPDADTLLWHTLLERVREAIAPALDRPAQSGIEEDYLVGLLQTLDTPLSAAQLRESIDIAALLSGEARTLSDGARQDLLRRSFSYYTDDLVVLGWDRAFVYEPRGDSDVADVIEVANAQLVEFRYYDELLDDELPQMYDRVEEAHRAAALFASRRFARLAHRLYTLVAEVTELTEKVDNALHVTEDVYLARIYSEALALFRVQDVSAAVARKLAIIRDTYAALYEEAASRRAEILEIAIVLLIVLEIVLAFMRQ